MRYAVIERERGTLLVKRACQLLKVSESGYYAWQKREVDHSSTSLPGIGVAVG